jgi:hypothetical protein
VRRTRENLPIPEDFQATLSSPDAAGDERRFRIRGTCG